MGRFRRELETLRGSIATAAQKIYDEWDQDEDGLDEEFGGGGICDRVSEAISDAVAVLDVDIFDGGQDGDDHAWIIAQRNGEAYGIDIPPQVYETGGGYNWKKIQGVTIQPGHVIIFPVPPQETED